MEFPRGAMTLERLLAGLLLAVTLATAWAESGSTLAARVRESGPWLAWIEASEKGRQAPPSFHLAVYNPGRRFLTLFHVPGATAEAQAEVRLRELSAEPLPHINAHLSIQISPSEPEDEPAIGVARELKAGGRRLRSWIALERGARQGLLSGDRTNLDLLLFALELRRIPVENIAPVHLPEKGEASALLGHALSSHNDFDDGRAPSLEVLNGTQTPGLASEVAKVLRSKNIDVLTMGSARPRARTVVYDHAGNFRDAEKMRAALGCSSARTVTRLDSSRAVDVSIELGDDCAGLLTRGEAQWNSSKF